jgi:long-chain acyl-CoA synthetase
MKTLTCVDDLYRAAETHPNHVALNAGGVAWTNQRLAAETDRLARALMAHGVQSGDRIVLHMTNVPELAAAYYACFLIGALATPLNIRLKTDELQLLLQRLEPKLYLGQADLYPAVAPIEAAIIAHDARFVLGEPAAGSSARLWNDLFGKIPEVPVPFNDNAELPAILLPTSGTTGSTKFVTHSLKTIAAISASVVNWGLDREQVVIINTPMVHASGFSVLMASMHHRVRSVLIERFDPDAVLDAIERHEGTWMLGLPYMYPALIESQRRNPRNVSSLRFFINVGDVCSITLQEEFRAVFGIPLSSTWAMTETVGLLTPGLRPGPVSRTAPAARFRLIDDDGEPVSRGATGELLLRGPGLTIGYWQAPDRIDPVGADGWLHTGDLMHQGEGDELWFVGRRKDLLVRGGSNISPSEVEHVLRRHPAVKDAVVVGLPDAVLGQRIVGLVCLAGMPSRMVVDDILASTKEQIADYKLPEELVVIDSIPRNALGKVDRDMAAAMFREAASIKGRRLLPSPRRGEGLGH